MSVSGLKCSQEYICVRCLAVTHLLGLQQQELQLHLLIESIDSVNITVSIWVDENIDHSHAVLHEVVYKLYCLSSLNYRLQS